MNWCVLALAGALALAGCNEDNPPPVNAVVATSMAATAWVFSHSPNMPGQPSPNPIGWEFGFPTQDGVHHLLQGVAGRFGGTSMRAGFKIEKEATARFVEVQPCPPSPNVARARLFFQRRGDDWSGAGKYEFYRWFSVDTFALADDARDGLTVPLQPEAWTSVLGKAGGSTADATAGFIGARADVQAIGFAFGGCYAAHGAYVADGAARFVATDFRIE